LLIIQTTTLFIVYCIVDWSFWLLHCGQSSFSALLQCLKLIFANAFISIQCIVLLTDRILSHFYIIFYKFLQFLCAQKWLFLWIRLNLLLCQYATVYLLPRLYYSCWYSLISLLIINIAILFLINISSLGWFTSF
jgi:hypothetical protein